MRFDVAGDERGVTLIASRDGECAAQVVDFSRGGMQVCFSAGPRLTVEQDVLIADDQTVSVCTVRNISDSDAGQVTVGLPICHTFPIAKLPEKKRAQWPYKDDVAPRQSSSLLWMAVLFLMGIGTPIALLNFNAARTYVSNWAALAGNSKESGRDREVSSQLRHDSASVQNRHNCSPADIERRFSAYTTCTATLAFRNRQLAPSPRPFGVHSR